MFFNKKNKWPAIALMFMYMYNAQANPLEDIKKEIIEKI